MASIRRPHSPAKQQQQHLLRHPFSTSPPSSPLRYSSSSSSSPLSSSSSSSPPRGHYYYSHLNPYHYSYKSSPSCLRRPLHRFLSFFLLGSFLGLLHFISFLPHPHSDHIVPSNDHAYAGAAIGSHHHHHHHQINSEAEEGEEKEKEKLLIVVTPTHARAAQAYHLQRLAHTLRQVPPPLLWVVVEMGGASQDTAHVLRRSAVMYRHVPCDRANSSTARAASRRQMNAALELIEIHRLDGIVYFADEENVYSLQLFHHLRQIRRFGAWPVPTLSQNKNDAILEGPVCKQSKVVGWHTNGESNVQRRFHVAMSGYAFNSTMLWDPQVRAHLSWNAIRHLDIVEEEGSQETTFVEQLVEDESQMEGIPSNCSQIMNWHLQFDSENLANPKGWSLSRNLDVTIPLK